MWIIILIGTGFYQLAKRKGLIPILWAIIAVASYYAAQLISAYIVLSYRPSILSYTGAEVGLALGSGGVGLLLVWIGLNKVAKKKKEVKDTVNEDVLDDRYLEEL